MDERNMEYSVPIGSFITIASSCSVICVTKSILNAVSKNLLVFFCRMPTILTRILPSFAVTSSYWANSWRINRRTSTSSRALRIRSMETSKDYRRSNRWLVTTAYDQGVMEGGGGEGWLHSMETSKCYRSQIDGRSPLLMIRGWWKVGGGEWGIHLMEISKGCMKQMVGHRPIWSGSDGRCMGGGRIHSMETSTGYRRSNRW